MSGSLIVSYKIDPEIYVTVQIYYIFTSDFIMQLTSVLDLSNKTLSKRLIHLTNSLFFFPCQQMS